jgi:hypothetical protein
LTLKQSTLEFKNVDAAAGTVDIEYNLEKDLARLNFKEVMVVVVL